VVRYLEDDPNFNAGKGAVFHADGGHELDASIMDGRDKACGAVAAVTTVKNPVCLARMVMTKTRHILLVGAGAERFARETGVELVGQDYFYTEAQRQVWQRAQRKGREQSRNTFPLRYLGTVGCVARDGRGNLAAATSTGGLTNKRPGRVGDTPIIGAGNYADNQTCAVSGTGIGEQFIRHSAAYEVAALMKYKGLRVTEAVEQVVRQRLKPDQGGLIAVSRDGKIAIDYNTGGMAWAAADSSGRFEVRWSDPPP
jgi:beta-aspartyl-peptidase (threonine type)